MSWKDLLNGDPLPWLLEPAEPTVRYLALRDLLDLPADHRDLLAAQHAALYSPQVTTILAAMEPEGYWVKSGSGYNPKYRSTVWSLILLAQLGVHLDWDERISAAVTTYLDHALALQGQFTSTGAPSGTIDCLQGNMSWALLELGCEDPRLDVAFDWMARTVTGEGLAPNSESRAPARYYAYKCGPNFACGANMTLPCAWGAAKVMLAFSRLPAARRSPLIERSIAQGVDFLFSVDPASGEYPSGMTGKPSGNWWKFGFPVFYVTDILQIVEALVQLGYGGDPRLANALALVRQKQDAQGRWALEYDYTGKTWVDFGPKKQPNKWVTLRALRALKGAER